MWMCTKWTVYLSVCWCNKGVKKQPPPQKKEEKKRNKKPNTTKKTKNKTNQKQNKMGKNNKEIKAVSQKGCRGLNLQNYNTEKNVLPFVNNPM